MTPGARSPAIDDQTIEQYRVAGFVVLGGAFDPGPLADEVQRSIDAGFGGSGAVRSGGVGNEFQYIPMTGARTPVSRALLDAVAPAAAQLLGRAAIPVRAKGTRYFGATSWHTDSDLGIPSVAFVAYLEPLDADSGALRIWPGSHPGGADVPMGAVPVAGAPDNAGEALATRPGDLIAFDEHLAHASAGRDTRAVARHQWRVDFLADPVGTREEALARRYLDEVFPPGWDGGYDVDAFPSYDDHWRRSGRPGIERLAELGAYERAAAEEDAARALRQSS